jgi:hypothetical protein
MIMLKKILILGAIIINMLFIVGCDDSESSDQSGDETTNLVYEGDNMAMALDSMLYSLSIGPLDVSSYEQIRIVTYGNSGTGNIIAQVYGVNQSGESIGILDEFNLDMSSASSEDQRYTGVYDVPGQRIMISYTSSIPGDKYLSCFVYAR